MLAEFKVLGAGVAVIALAGVGNGIGVIFGSLLNVFQDCEDLKYSIINHFFTKNNTFVEVSF